MEYKRCGTHHRLNHSFDLLQSHPTFTHNTMSFTGIPDFNLSNPRFGTARFSPYPNPRNRPSIEDRIAALESAVFATTTAEPEPSSQVRGNQSSPPAHVAYQLVLDSQDNLTRLPAPIGTPDAWRGEGRPDEPVDKTAPRYDARHWLRKSEIKDIMSIEIAPTEEAALAQIRARASVQNAFYDVFLAKRVITLITKLGTSATALQLAFKAEYKMPEWFYTLTKPSARSAKPERSEKTSKKSMPTAADPLEKWDAYFVANPDFRLSGVLRLPDGKPRPDLLEGRNILKRLGPKRPPSKAEERRTTNSPMHLIAPFFGADGTAYANKIRDLEIAIAPVWAPTAFGPAANLALDDFVRHAAACGLTLESADGPVRAFCNQWCTANATASTDAPDAVTHGVGSRRICKKPGYLRQLRNPPHGTVRQANNNV